MQSFYFNTWHARTTGLLGARSQASTKPVGFRRETTGGVLPDSLPEIHIQARVGGKISAKRLLMAGCSRCEEELTGIIGGTFISDQDVRNPNLIDNNLHFGNGLTFQVNYGRHLMGKGFSRFEVPGVFDWDEKVHFAANLMPGSYSSFLVTPALRANISGAGAVSPWLSAGGGIGHFGCPITWSWAVQTLTRARSPASFKWASVWT